jgi:ATP-dependent helicase/nuclease subunit B
MRSAFLDHLGGETILLPHIRPLGEFDEDAGSFDSGENGTIEIPPAIDSTERLLLLGTLIRQWTRHLKVDIGALYGDETIGTPVSTADAFWLARDLAALMDQFSTEQVPVAALSEFDTSELSEWWKVTLAFLEIMRNEWPAILAERGLIDPGEHRNLRILAEAARLSANPPPGPVIVAGSTGTIPATAELISAVARLPLGAVVLPGIDRTMDDASRDALASDEDVASVIGHPQYGLHKLVKRIGIAPDAVEEIGGNPDAALEQRRMWVAESLRPAKVTDRWTGTRAKLTPAAFDNVALLVAQNEHLEAAAIAVALREAVNEPAATAALVTPDRELARRVVAELARYGISATDTGGTPIASSRQGRLLSLILEAVLNPGNPSTLLALLKHPLVTLSADEEDHRRMVDLLEMAILRGGTGRLDPARITDFVRVRMAEVAADEHRDPRWMSRMAAGDFERLVALAEHVEEALRPLTALVTDDSEVPQQRLVAATVLTLECLCRDENGFHDPLYGDEAGAVFRGFLAGLVAGDVPLFLSPSGWPQAIRALMADVSVKPAPGGHPRISIWGTLEARLQTVDLMILGGLNEGVWPRQTQNDQFLTRAMKSGLGLEPPERRIGLSAHDFQMAMGQKRVVLARSERAEGAPAIASRWLQRLTTFAGEEATEAMIAEGNRYIAFAREMEAGNDTNAAKRPYPKPPLSARPTSLSVTEVETLIRDPYAIYAKKVLGLRPIDELVRDPGAAERGSLFHAIFEAIVRNKVDPLAPDAGVRVLDLARTLFDEEELPPDIRAIWWPRVEAAVESIAEWEAARANRIDRRFAEITATPTGIDMTGVTLRGRADRMDVRLDGSVDIIDFKTGAPPSGKTVRALLAPQLPLEGALLSRGAFREIGKAEIADMLYVKIDPKGAVEEKRVLKGDRQTGDADPHELSEAAWEKLSAMLVYFADEANGYQSQRMPQKIHDRHGDYDHLARLHEWRSGDGDGDE